MKMVFKQRPKESEFLIEEGMGAETKYSKTQLSKVYGKCSLEEFTCLHKGETPTDARLEPFAASSLRELAYLFFFTGQTEV